MVVQSLLDFTAAAGVDTGGDSSLLLLADIDECPEKTRPPEKRLQN
jgi:hypothetical protein